MAEEEGSGKSKEMLDAARFREAAHEMENGNVKAKTKVAFYKLTGLGGVEVDEGAVSLLEERANDGDNEAKWMLGLCCEYGIGIEQDIERAVLLYLQSSERGNVVGEFLFENGEGGRGNGVMKVEGLWKKEDILSDDGNNCLYMNRYDRRDERKTFWSDLYCTMDWTEYGLWWKMIKGKTEWRKRRIKTKNWTGKNIGDLGAKMISEVLKSNSTLTKLNLRSDEKEE